MSSTEAADLARAEWRKSSYSGGGNQCVEVARIGGEVAVRDSKNDGGGHLRFSAAGWEAFLDDIRRGSYDQ
jgi:Domain of unknown function (DUF397)